MVKAKRFEEAERELQKLVEANKLGAKAKWEFNEWIHPNKREAMGGQYHAWSAGAYLLALTSVSDKAVPFF